MLALIQYFPNFSAERLVVKGLLQKTRSGLQGAVMGDYVLRVSGDEESLCVRPYFLELLG